MRFWDSSALVPLIIEEPRSAACRALRRADPSIVVWMFSRIEILSAIHRRVREGSLERSSVTAVERRLAILESGWTVVEAAAAVCEGAERLIRTHPITAADAVQLSAALLATGDRPRRRWFITSDQILADAAGLEGFSVTVPGR
ncbi:MAG: type II toxin-antitoxin system VapC family toxin [Myxococcaceae bacterium]|nr:type II toxin-antitoxin system VapC family toxin [Myxococcaceae bacterium]